VQCYVHQADYHYCSSTVLEAFLPIKHIALLALCDLSASAAAATATGARVVLLVECGV
jgi:hypothetical protein